MSGEAIAYSSLAMRTRLDHRDLLKKNPQDFLIIHGFNDPLVSIEKLEEELSGVFVEVMKFEHSGHMSHLEEPETFLAALKIFLG